MARWGVEAACDESQSACVTAQLPRTVARREFHAALQIARRLRNEHSRHTQPLLPSPLQTQQVPERAARLLFRSSHPRTGIASRTFALMVFPSSSESWVPGLELSWEDGMNPRMLGVSASST